MNFLDRFTRVHRLRGYSAAKRYAALRRRALRDARESIPPTIIPIEDTKYILRHGKKAYRAAKERGEI